MDIESEPIPVYFYFDFINKLIRAGRNDGTKFYFKFNSEINQSDFIKFANKFIEDYYASVPPEFAITHPMKFSFGTVTEDGLINLNKNISSAEVAKYPELNGGLLYIKQKNDGDENSYTYDASIFRQACFIKRERLKYIIKIIGAIVAISTLILSVVFNK